MLKRNPLLLKFLNPFLSNCKDHTYSFIILNDLNGRKDKWRNINVTLSGLGSREKARLALRRDPQTPALYAHDYKPGALSSLVRGEEKTGGSKPHSGSPSLTDDKGQAAELERSRTRC